MKRVRALSSCTVFCGLLSVVVTVLAACSAAPPAPQVATPTISPTSGAFMNEIKITITCDNPDATVYYTTNGATPSMSSLVYKNDIDIKGQDADIVAIACAPGMQDSEPAQAEFFISWLEYPRPSDPPASNPFNNPQGITVDADGRIYVTSGTSAGYLTRLDNMCDGSPERADGYNNPSGIMVRQNGQIFIANSNSGQIVRMDAFEDTVRTLYGVIGTPGDGAGHFTDPNGIADAGGGTILVADTGNDRFVITDMGSTWVPYGSTGSGVDQFSKPRGIAVDLNNKIYVADTENDRIAAPVGTGSGTTWQEMGGLGKFNKPGAVAVDSSYRIYVADTENNRIVRMDNMNGDGWTVIGTGSAGGGQGRFNRPSGIAVDAQNRVYVADSGNNRLVRVIFP